MLNRLVMVIFNLAVLVMFFRQNMLLPSPAPQ